jgi:large subunit ribosomal protein L29
MKASELREQSTPELQGRVANLRDEWFRLRFQRVSKQLPNPMRIRAVRKDLARILTILAEREHSAGAGEAPRS